MGLLDGLRVLDLTMWRPGPYATQLLGRLGADVVKVEPPGGEPMRVFRDHFDVLNRHKRSVELDLKTDAGLARCLELAKDAEVFVEGFRPGVADRLGVGYARLREAAPALVYCSISGYGAEGPLVDVPGHDVNYRAYAGALAQDTTAAGAELAVADMAAATMAAFAITAAVLKARQTGAGERIDLAMADVLADWVETSPNMTDADAPVPGYGIYPTKDGRTIALGVVSEQALWAATCRALGLERHADVPFLQRFERLKELDGRIADAVAALTRDEALARLSREGAPVAPVLTRTEMLAHEHFRARGIGTGPIRTANQPNPSQGTAPELDEHRGEGWRLTD